MELDNENMGEESDRLNKELASVLASLKRLRSQNSQLNIEIEEKNAAVNKQQVQIKSQEADVQKIGTHVSRVCETNLTKF